MFFFHPAPQDQRADIPPRHAGAGWSLLPAVALAALMVLGGILTVPASSRTAQPEPTDGRSVDIPAGAAVRLKLLERGLGHPSLLRDTRSGFCLQDDAYPRADVQTR